MSAGVWVSLLLAILAASAAQPEAPSAGTGPEGQPSGPTQQVATASPPAHFDQLQTCREGITDPEARPADRRRWADLLFSYRSPQADELIIELLQLNRMPDVQRAVCAVLADRAKEAVDRLTPTMVPPLIELLAADAEDLRTHAARALSEFPDAAVARQLGALAASKEAPLSQRLAAVDALAPNVHRREVVSELIALLDVDESGITQRCVSALEAAAPVSFGQDPAAWRAWWTQQSAMDQEAWLAQQLRIYRDRYRATAAELARSQEETRREQTALTGRIRSFQREVFRTVAEDQRDAKLVEWLNGQLPVVRLGAVSIIKTRMADEGKRPEGAVLTALLGLLKEKNAEARREVLQIAQNLNNPMVVKAVLDHLPAERDPATRHAVFRALGRLDGVDAIPALIREIAAPDSYPDCVREAAIALGTLAGKAEHSDNLSSAVEPLLARYRATGLERADMRAALLTAMAGIADTSFAEAFLEAVESDDPATLQSAIRGIVRLRDVSKLRRLRTLMAYPDPLVRREAIDAVAQLGREEADVESLLTRLNPAIEANDLAREAAWQGFRNQMSQRPLPDRIDAADRLRDVPAYQIKYLEQLADSAPSGNGNEADRERVYEKLASALEGQQRFAEAVVRLRRLYDLRLARGATESFNTGLRLLRALLRSAGGGVATLVKELALLAQDDSGRARIIETITEFLDRKDSPPSSEQLRALLTDLRTVPPEELGASWSSMIEKLAARIDATDKGASRGSSSPSPGR